VIVYRIFLNYSSTVIINVPLGIVQQIDIIVKLLFNSIAISSSFFFFVVVNSTIQLIRNCDSSVAIHLSIAALLLTTKRTRILSLTKH
jgi:hypothetical protein